MANEIGASSTGAAIGLVGDLATTFINRKFQKEDWKIFTTNHFCFN